MLNIFVFNNTTGPIPLTVPDKDFHIWWTTTVSVVQTRFHPGPACSTTVVSPPCYPSQASSHSPRHTHALVCCMAASCCPKWSKVLCSVFCDGLHLPWEKGEGGSVGEFSGLPSCLRYCCLTHSSPCSSPTARSSTLFLLDFMLYIAWLGYMTN